MTIEDIDTAYSDFHLNLLNTFIEQIKDQPPFCLENCDQDDQEFLNELDQLPKVGGSELLIQGQQLFCRIVAGYPHLMPLVPRDLLWFFGGDCLHYMPDEEISVFQKLDELRQSAKDSNETFSYEKARLSTMGLH
ncbi:MAG: dehydrogenase [Gammaproteobacteria bacterium]|nr:MAG: dehydrogenase [Gammaproteobacteria bacterium]